MKELKTIRGMPDLYGPEVQAISFVEKTCEKVFRSFNFKEFRTPILENKSLFERSVGDTSDIIQKEMYELQDRKGENLCLRPEGTAGLVRALITNGLDDLEIKKYFYIGPMFRYERPQKGRKRQFVQAGIELVGDDSINADVEILQVAKIVLEQLSIPSELEINFIGDIECIENFRNYLRDYLQQYKDQIEEKLYFRLLRNPIRALDSKDEKIKDIIKDARPISDFFTEEQKTRFEDIKLLLDSLEINYKVNPNLVRGLDYYTGLVFEFTNNNLGAQNAILGGGRYDNLIADLGGNKIPATGFALGVDRLAEIVATNSDNSGIFLGSLDSKSKACAQKLGFKLRSNNPTLNVETYLGNANLNKQLKKADSFGFKFVIIIGQEELNSGVFKLKSLGNAAEDQDMTEKELLEKFS